MQTIVLLTFLDKLRKLDFSPMSPMDLRTFGGVESEDPWIAYTSEQGAAVILDGSKIIIVNNDGEEHQLDVTGGGIENQAVLDEFLA